MPQLQKKRAVKIGIRNSGGMWNPAKTTVAGRLYASGEDTGGPIIHDVVKLRTGSIAFAIDPLVRRRGLGRSMR